MSPTYDYKCDCGHKEEILKSMLKCDEIEKCPICKNNMKRLIGSGAGFIFKGSGFYHTDVKMKEAKNQREKK